MGMLFRFPRLKRLSRCCTWCDVAERMQVELLRRIEQKLDRLIAQGDTMAIDFQQLTAAVERNTSVDQSAIQALQGLNQSVQDLKQQIADLIANGADPAAIQAAIDAYAAQLNASTDALAAAVPANT